MPANVATINRLRARERALIGAGFTKEAAKLAVYGTPAATDTVLDMAAPQGDIAPVSAAANAPLEAQVNYFEAQAAADGKRTPRAFINDLLRSRTPNIQMRYDRGDQVRRELIDYMAIAEGESAMRQRDTMADFSIALHTVTPIVTGLQQAWYGALRGEHPAEFAQRLFPEVTIQDSQGKQQKKWQALVGLQLLRQRIFGDVAGARETALALAEEAGEDLLEFRDVFEANLSGHGLLGIGAAEMLPPENAPERAAAEQTVEDTGAEFYRNMVDHGPLGNAGLAGLSTIFATMEVANDPMIAVAPAAPGAVNLLRKTAPVSSVARITGAIAARTKDFDHILRAVEDADRWVKAAEKKFNITHKPNDGVRLLQARKQHARALAALEAKKDPGPAEAFLPVTPRKTPGAVKDKDYTIDHARLSADGFNSAEDRKRSILSSIQTNIRRKMLDGSPQAEVEALDAQYRQLAAMDADKIPLDVTPAGTPATDLNAVINAERRQALAGDAAPITDFDDPLLDAASVEQRFVYGPDDAEMNGEAFRLLAAGADIDDVAVREMSVPAYVNSYNLRLRNLTNDGMLDVNQLARTERKYFDRLERARVKRIKELEELGKTRELTDAEGMELLEHRTSKYAYDDSWLPSRSLTTDVERAQWQQTVAERMGDVYARTLYPESWVLRPPAMLRAALYPFREPMRVMSSMSPEMYGRVRNALYSAEFEMRRMAEFFDQELARAGVKDRVGAEGRVVSRERSEQLFDLLDTDPRSDNFAVLMEQADDNMRTSVRRIRAMFDYMADKQGISESERFITGYINHVFTGDMRANGAMPYEMFGMSPKARTFAAHLLDRTGKRGYERDPLLALDIYSRAASRKLHIEPMLQDIQAAAKAFVKANPADAWFGGYVDDLVAMFKGTPSLLGHRADKIMRELNQAIRKDPEFRKLWSAKLGDRPIPVYENGDLGRTVMAITSLAYSGALTGNARYFPMAVATGIATTAPRFGLFRTLQSLFGMATPEGQALARAAGIRDQWKRVLEEPAWKSIAQHASEVHAVAPSIASTENFIRSVTYHAAKEEYMKRLGLSTWREVEEHGLANRIVTEAARATEEINHLFGQLGKPPGFARVSRSGSVALTQFLSFIPKQMEELAAQTMKNPGNILSYLTLSGYVTRVAAQDLGVDLSSYVGFGFMPRRAEDITAISTDLLVAMERWNSAASERLMGTGNPDEVAKTHGELLRAVETFLPLSAMIRQNVARATEPFTGERRGAGGELVRTLDLDWLNSRKGERGDLPGVLTQLRSVNDKLETQRQEADRRVAENKALLLRRLTFEYRQAVASADTTGMAAAHKAFADNGIPLPEVTGIVEHEALSLVVDRETRDIMENLQLTGRVMEETARLNAARGGPR